MVEATRNKLILLIITNWFVVGAVVTVAAFLNVVYWPLVLLLLLPMATGLWLAKHLLTSNWRLNSFEKLLGLLLVFTWLLHLTGVFVPETGFDAVWYHLPVAELVVVNHGLTYTPDLYQTLNPLFSDLIFTLGFMVAGDTGAKLIAYGFGLSLVVVSYGVARQVLARPLALLTVLLISTFQVMAWQSSSFYIDNAKAFWEVAVVWVLIVAQKNHSQNRWLVFSSLLVGATLASKAFSLLLLPIFIFEWWWISRSALKTFALTLAAIIIVLPFYLRSYFITGDAFSVFTIPLKILGDFSSSASPIEVFIHRLVALPSSWWELLLSRDYITPLLVLLPILVFHFKYIYRSQTILLLTLFGVWQWLVWWFVPPLSTRYALSGFIVLLIVLTAVLAHIFEYKKWPLRNLYAIMLLSFGLTLIPRLFVLNRNLPYLLGWQTKSQYLEQFYDGNIDTVLKKWHL